MRRIEGIMTKSDRVGRCTARRGVCPIGCTPPIAPGKANCWTLCATDLVYASNMTLRRLSRREVSRIYIEDPDTPTYTVRNIPERDLANTAARAILWSGVRNDGQHCTLLASGGLHAEHSMVGQADGQGTIDSLEERDALMERRLGDILDSVTFLDRKDGGFTLLLRVPGKVPTAADAPASQVTLDAYLPPREVAEHAHDLEQPLRQIAHTFFHTIAIPHLQRLASRFDLSGLPAVRGGDVAASQLNNASNAMFKATAPSSSHYRVRIIDNIVGQDIFEVPSEDFDEEDSEMDRFFSSEAVISAVEEAEEELRRKRAVSKEQAFKLPLEKTNDPPQPARRGNAVSGHQPRVPARPGTINTSTSSCAVSSDVATLPGATVLSIGHNTDKALDQLKLDDSVIPELRSIMSTVRSTRWTQAIMARPWGIGSPGATKLAHAMLCDLGLISGLQPRRRSWLQVFIFLLVLVESLLLLYLFYPA